MNELRIFENDEFGTVRTVVINGEPWFVGKDIALSLGYKDTVSAIKQHVDNEDKRGWQITTPGGTQQMMVINESGLYALIFGSKLKSSKKFKHWVTHEVLPEIRKTGNYSVNSRQDSYMIENPAERARRWAEEYEERLALESKVSELQPKAYVYDKMLDSKLLVNFRDAAKEIGISQSQFTGWLKENGYVYSNSAGELRPMEQYMSSGLFEMKPYQNPHNGYCGSRTLVTPRGLAAFKILLDTSGHNRDTMKKHGGRNSKTKRK